MIATGCFEVEAGVDSWGVVKGLRLLEGVARPLLVLVVGLRRRRMILVLLGCRCLGRAHLRIAARILLSAVQNHHVILLFGMLLCKLLEE